VRVTLDAPVVTPHRDTSVLVVLPYDVAVTVSAADTNKGGHIEKYYWDIGANGWDDSTTVPSFVVNVKTEGSFKIRWAARDDDKQMTDDTFNITVSRQPLGTPTIVVQKSARVKINDSLTITSQGTAAQGGGRL
jgi:hypothetical protein